MTNPPAFLSRISSGIISQRIILNSFLNPELSIRRWAGIYHNRRREVNNFLFFTFVKLYPHPIRCLLRVFESRVFECPAERKSILPFSSLPPPAKAHRPVRLAGMWLRDRYSVSVFEENVTECLSPLSRSCSPQPQQHSVIPSEVEGSLATSEGRIILNLSSHCDNTTFYLTK